MPICDKCGTGLPVGYDYCFQCGYPVRGLPPDAPSAGVAGGAGTLPPPAPGDAAGTAPFGLPLPFGYGGASPNAAPAAVARTQVLAGWSLRLVAALIDYMVVSLVIGMVGYFWFADSLGGSQGLISHLVGDTSSSRPMLILEAALMGGFFVYNMICEAVFHATLGKRVLSLHVVAYGGASPGVYALLVRNLTKALSCLVPFAGVPIAMVSIALDANNQRIGDRLARTYVLRDVVTIVAPGTPR
jgi:uncharacterized RDD family membrane protein YckC